MDAAFTSIAFAEPARAEANLALVGERLPGALWATLPTLLAQVPDPDGALNYLERYLRDLSPRVTTYLERHPAALHYLLVIFSHSRFLSETLIQQPELITWLHRPPGRDTLEQLKTPDDLHEEFARFQATQFDLAPSVVLARFKRREYLRITLRDVLGLATLAETTLELSQLADVLLDRALRIADQRLRNQYGAPQHTDAAGRRHTVGLAILSLGKLGGQELNYASDIDLMFLYGAEGETAGGPGGAIANAEYFVRLAQAVLKLITEPTPEGAVYRVDLRLRPQGAEGDIALSLPAALDYYQHRAREWELQMLIKARGSAGDAGAARRFLREVQPRVYRRDLNLAAVEAVLNARQEMTRALGRRPGRMAEQWNVKLSPGGIRDIEFLTQCLQRLYGGADAWLAGAPTAATLVALQRLHDKGYLSGRDFFRLGTAYQFLRRVEHRLQLRDGLQRHTLPEAPDALERLARRCGVDPAPAEGRSAGQQLLQRIGQHFAEVRQIYERILQSPAAPAAETNSAAADAAMAPLLRRLRREYPPLAAAMARAAADVHARRGLDRFLASALLSPAVMAELAAHPAWVERAAAVFSRSELAAEMLARHPEGIATLAQPEARAGRPLPAAAPNADTDAAMAALRIAYRQRQLALVVRALVGDARPFDTFAVLSELAGEVLRAALTVAAREVDLPAAGDTEQRSAPLAVLALGRLGSQEFDIGSDADLVFVVANDVTVEQRAPWRRLAERFVHIASSHTRDGLLFPVDTRLRPHGTGGEILLGEASLADYFRSEAQGWEAATWLKARPVAGNLSLGAAAIERVREILAARFGPASECGSRELAAQLLHTRERLETEGAAPGGKGEFKKTAGGFYDLEYVISFLFLTRGVAHPAGNVLRQIAALESGGALDGARAQALRSAAVLYRALEHAVRLVTGHTPRGVPEPALAGRVAPLLEAWAVPLPAATAPGEAIAAAVSAAREQLRALYTELLPPAARK